MLQPPSPPFSYPVYTDISSRPVLEDDALSQAHPYAAQDRPCHAPIALEAVPDAAMSNFERTRAEKIFWIVTKSIDDFFYNRPALGKGLPGWILHQLGRPLRLYRSKIWNRYAYNKDGRMTNRTALRTIAFTALAIIALSCVVLTLI
jgi:hypothetical protein